MHMHTLGWGRYKGRYAPAEAEGEGEAGAGDAYSGSEAQCSPRGRTSIPAGGSGIKKFIKNAGRSALRASHPAFFVLLPSIKIFGACGGLI